MRPKLLAAIAIATALTLGGCQNPDGSTNWGNTLLLGAGVGVAAALAAGAASDDRPHRGRGYGRSRYDRGLHGGYADSRFGGDPRYGRW